MIRIAYELDNRKSVRFFDGLLKMDAYLAGLQRANMPITILEQREATEEEYAAYQVELNQKATKALGEARQRDMKLPENGKSEWHGKMVKVKRPLNGAIVRQQF